MGSNSSLSGVSRGSQNSHETLGAEASLLLPHLRHRYPRPRDGRVIEEIGSYDPTIPLTDARCKLDHERVKYWLGVGAKPSDRVSILIKKYGPEGTHLKQHEEALAQLKAPKVIPDPGPPAAAVAKKKKAAEEASAEGAAAESTPAPEAAAEPGVEATPPSES